MLSKNIFQNFFKALILVLLLGILTLIILPKESISILQIRDIGKKLGTLSTLLFCLAITGGIINRIQGLFTSQKLATIKNYLMFSRLQIGVSMFIAGLGHYLLSVILPILKYGKIIEPKFFFIFGLLALFLSFLLALTSNRFSKKLLKTKWKLLHSSVYIIVWLIFLHVALIDFMSPIAIVVLIFAILEISSLIYAKIKTKTLPNRFSSQSESK